MRDKSKKLKTILFILLGIITGLIIYIIQISNITSYLTDDSKACINCHVMNPQYSTWNHSSHRGVAKCNDCHVPQENIIRKYYFKTKDGLYHASVFTFKNEPQTIYMKEESQEIVKRNCVRCHFQQIVDVKSAAWVNSHIENRTDRKCWECHRETPHGRVNSLASVGYQTDPINPKLNIPEWISVQLNNKQNKK